MEVEGGWGDLGASEGREDREWAGMPRGCGGGGGISVLEGTVFMDAVYSASGLMSGSPPLCENHTPRQCTYASAKAQLSGGR
jgi:hypothetical protein